MDFEEVEFGSRRGVRKVVTVQPASPPRPRKKPSRAKAEPRSAGRDSSSAVDSTDGVLVPLDQWTKILNQLGNLHQAGQELADARERAAKAETEAMFLRDRLRELREELASERQAVGNRRDRIDLPGDDGDPAGLEDEDVEMDISTDRVLVVKLPSRLTRWWLERRPSER